MESPATDAGTFDADGALSRHYLLSRGYCCENGCRNCPYGFEKAEEGAATVPGFSLTPKVGAAPEAQVSVPPEPGRERKP